MNSLLCIALASCVGGQLPVQSDSGIKAWAREHAVPIDSSGRAFRSLDQTIAPSRLIGIGESVHEVQQFMAFRFAILSDLVRRNKVTALILESGFAEATALDDYVRGRRHTVDYASALGYDLAPYEEIRRAMRWLREWNLGAGKAHPVGIYGADLANGASTMLPALDHLRAVAQTDAATVALIDSLRPIAARVSDRWWRPASERYATLTTDERRRLTDATTRLVSSARAWRGGSEEDRAWAERFALVVQQVEEVLRKGQFAPENPRDQSMAANTRWVLSRLPPGERAVLWAHNAHVQRVPIKVRGVTSGSPPSMGFLLAQEMGRGYVAIGTAYGGASLDSAMAPAEGSVDAALGGVAAAPFLIALRNLPRNGEVGSWLRTERPMRFQVGHLMVPLAAAFDAIVYFDRASPAIRAP